MQRPTEPTPRIDPHDDIALIGIGCRLPGGAGDPRALWKLLCDGVDAIRDIPADRWDPDRYYSPDPRTPGRVSCRRAGCLDRVDTFDAAFFGIAPRIAEQMDPQQRILLETAWEALEDAGAAPTALAGSLTGVYMGVCSHDYSDIQSLPTELEGLSAHSATGNFMSIVANRLSYTLDLRGPSMALDTACSSSLVAVHLACAALRQGECDLALAGGVNVMLSPHFPISLSQATMLSPDGLSRAFDASANGYVRGEGAGVAVLKPLRQALRDRDRIYAVIRGTSVNQDGRTAGITVPSEASQEANFLAAVRQAGIAPSEIGYVEAHGTGTPVGDPIEANAIGKVLNAGGQRGADRKALLGSIKTNIGHLEAGAGIAGLIKAALAVYHRQIPPNLHFARPNPQIDFERWRLAVPAKVEPWPEHYAKAVASVNSFGFGGTNANVVLEEPPGGAPAPRASTVAPAPRASTVAPAPPAPGAPERQHLLPLSARSEPALRQLAEACADAFEQRADSAEIGDVARSLARRRSHHAFRIAVTASDLRGAAASLREHLRTQRVASVAQGQQKAGAPRKIAFVFNGQGPQWWAMGRQLLEQEPVFRQVVEECDRLARDFIDWSIVGELSATEQASRVQETRVLQPLLFALQMGLVALWRSWGVKPEAVVGHSLGDISAACVAGLIDLRTALLIICHRSRIQEKADPEGGMLYATLSPAEAEGWCRRFPGALWLSAVNSQQAVTFSGQRAVLATVLAELQARGAFARILRVNCACHSPHMDPLQAELMERVQETRTAEGALSFYSTVAGRKLAGSSISPVYWWDNFRQPVRFHDALTAMLDDGVDTFLEVSPHPVLLQAIRDVLREREREGLVLHSLRRGEDDRSNLLGSLSTLYVEGADLRWDSASAEPVGHVELPRHPWERQSYWCESKVGQGIRRARQAHAMIRRVDEAIPTWETRWDDHRLTWVKDHHLFGGVMVPAAGYLEIALSAAAELTGERCALGSVEFERPCLITDGEPTITRVFIHPESASFEIHSRLARDDVWTRHVKGRFWKAEAQPAGGRRSFDVEQIRSRCGVTYGASEIYERVARKGYLFGPTFRGIQQLHVGHAEGLARVEPPRALGDRTQGYTIHPALMDACFQSGVVLPSREYGSDELLQFTYLLARVGRVRVYGDVDRPFWAYIQAHRIDAAGFSLDAYMLNDAGEVVAEFLDFHGSRVDDLEARRDRLEEHLYVFPWRDRPAPDQGAAASSLLAGKLEGLHRELRPVISELSAELGRAAYHDEYAPRVRELCVLYLARCLRDLGLPLAAGDEIDPAKLSRVSPAYRAWVQRSLEFLAQHRFLSQRGSRFEVVAPPRAQGEEELFSELAQAYTACHPELMALRRTGPALARVIRGEQDPLALLFPGGSHEATEPLYQTAPVSRVYNLLVQRAVERLVERADPERPLRVLEVGAGTGGLTAYLVPVLPPDRTRYHFTDISAAFLHTAKEKLAAHRFITFDLLDLEQDPESQGYAAGEYDLVVASDAIHATADLSASLDNLRRLLAPGGVAAIIEAMPDNLWLHLTFGLTEGWWRFQDYDTRRSGPLLPASRWLELLRKSGFEEAFSLSDVAEENGSGQLVLLAQAPALERGAPGDLPGPDAVPEAVPDAVPETVPETVKDWLVFADQGGLGARLAELVRRRGGRCTLVWPSGSAAGDGLAVAPNDAARIQEIVGGGAWEGVVHLWNLDAAAAPVDEPTLERSTLAGSLSVAHVMTALAKGGEGARSGDRAKLFVLTRGGQPARTPGVSLTQAPVWGLALVGGLELPEVRCRMIDLSPAGAEDEARQVWQELWRDDDEREVALRGADRLVRRVSRLPAEERLGGALSAEIVRTGGAFRLQSGSKGTLDHLLYAEKARTEPGPGEVEVEVRAAALNFFDVMTTLGQVPRLNALSQGLGCECAGVVTRVGAGVSGLRPRDEVIVVQGEQGAMASHLTTDARYVFPKPRSLSFEEACQLPIAFLTAWYSLHKLARVERGDRVLIHAATGGTGLACVQVARMLGAEVFATAGSEEKQAYLRALGVTHVMSSRSLEFADQVRAMTGGRGVDVVVNSLAGEAVSRGIASLAQYGRFVEIGKRDFLADGNLHLRPFLKNLSYFSFDLRQMLADHPERVREDFLHLLGLFQQGALRPLPHRVYPPAQAQQAFRHMMNAAHMGKLVLSLQEAPVSVVPRPERRAPSPGGTWLLAGGLGGLGLQMAEHLARRGVRHLVLLGRSVGEHARQRIRAIEQETSAQIRAEAVDVCDRPRLEATIREIQASMPPLRGVVHCAMVLEDVSLAGLGEAAMLRVVRPKMMGAWHLHELTADIPLEAFVLFSSMTSVLGNAGQGNYAVANAFLDGLAHHRKARGLPVTCVNWGVISDAGYVARQQGLRDRLAGIGAGGIESAEALDLLMDLVAGKHAQVGAFRVDWGRYARAVLDEGAEGQPRYEEVISEEQRGPEGSAAQRSARSAPDIDGQAGEERVELLREQLRRRLSTVLGLPADALDVDVPLITFLDSLLVVEIVSWIETKFGVKYALKELMKGPSVGRLAADLAQRIDAKPGRSS
ncbi:SDR family NAD(P)-dependent oxidoreductase [Sorangium sp. So ce1128]